MPAWAEPFVLAKYPHPYRVTVTSGQAEHMFRVAVAETAQTQERGLMFITKLPPDQGMLFLWPEGKWVGMWMRNTLIRLDMLFVDGAGTIFQIEANAKPESERHIAARKPAVAVLELAGGTADRLGIKEGDSLKWERISAQH